MDADPYVAGLVLHQVHVVVSRTDGAELRLRELREPALRLEVRTVDRVQHRMVRALLRGDAHAERDATGDHAHHRLDTAEEVEIFAHEIRAHRLVAATDVVADAGRLVVAL